MKLRAFQAKQTPVPPFSTTLQPAITCRFEVSFYRGFWRQTLHSLDVPLPDPPDAL